MERHILTQSRLLARLSYRHIGDRLQTPLIIKEALEWFRAHQVQLLEDWKQCYP